MSEDDTTQSSGDLPTIEVTTEEYDIIEVSEQVELSEPIVIEDDIEVDAEVIEQVDSKDFSPVTVVIAPPKNEIDASDSPQGEEDAHEAEEEEDVGEKENEKEEEVETQEEEAVKAEPNIEEEEEGEENDNGENVNDETTGIDDVDIDLEDEDDDHIQPSAPSISLLVDHSVDTIVEDKESEDEQEEVAKEGKTEDIEDGEDRKEITVAEETPKEEESGKDSHEDSKQLEGSENVSDLVPVGISSPCPCDEDDKNVEEVEDSIDGECSYGKIRLLFFREPEDDIMNVKVFRVDQMPSTTEGGSKDVSIHLCLKPASKQRYKTKMKSTSKARFDETYEFRKINNKAIESSTLRIRAYGKCKKIIGEAHIPLSMVKDFQYQEVWYYFSPFDKKKSKTKKNSEAPAVGKWYFAKNE
ncbi:high mobility group nucleosome-binding domain-containing protein 5-like [Clytia hemisphaerica]|uniref:C2 domain-containing protein n=1 Tax=Clytia hemisphaerica TaxID=252671 RepID=A0A7M6DLE8_9CNID